MGNSTDARSLVAKLYQAFNDPGFLGLGGTDEDAVLAALTSARDQGIMRDVDALYHQSYPTELNLKDRLDDELSGDDFRNAMRLYDEGMAASPDSAVNSPAGNSSRVAIDGTVAPGRKLPPKRFSARLNDFDSNPYAAKKCQLSSVDGSRVFFNTTTNDDGLMEGDVPGSEKKVKATLWPVDASEAESVSFEITLVEEIPPVTVTKGALLRLHNLGYYENEPGTEWGEDEIFSLHWFQLENKLPKLDAVDDAAGELLVKLHGC